MQAVQYLPEHQVSPGDRLQVTASHDTYAISFTVVPTEAHHLIVPKGASAESRTDSGRTPPPRPAAAAAAAIRLPPAAGAKAPFLQSKEAAGGAATGGGQAAASPITTGATAPTNAPMVDSVWHAGSPAPTAAGGDDSGSSSGQTTSPAAEAVAAVATAPAGAPRPTGVPLVDPVWHSASPAPTAPTAAAGGGDGGSSTDNPTPPPAAAHCATAPAAAPRPTGVPLVDPVWHAGALATAQLHDLMSKAAASHPKELRQLWAAAVRMVTQPEQAWDMDTKSKSSRGDGSRRSSVSTSTTRVDDSSSSIGEGGERARVVVSEAERQRSADYMIGQEVLVDARLVSTARAFLARLMR